MSNFINGAPESKDRMVALKWTKKRFRSVYKKRQHAGGTERYEILPIHVLTAVDSDTAQRVVEKLLVEVAMGALQTANFG